MNTCDTCKWWDRDERNPEWGECKNSMMVVNAAYQDMRVDGIYLHPGHDESTEAIIGAKFGCIHHESKDRSGVFLMPCKEASGSADIEPTEPHPSGIRY